MMLAADSSGLQGLSHPPLPPACVCVCAALLLSSTCTGIMRAPGKHYGKATTLTDL